MRSTKIQWCDDTVNPTHGCEGCELWSNTRRVCYAGWLTKRFGAGWHRFADAEDSKNFSIVTLHPGRLAKAAKARDLSGTARKAKPWLDGMPRLIFVSDMSDALSEVVPFEFLRGEVIANVTSENGRRHCWLWLTKRPDRMAEFSEYLRKLGVEWPLNLWAGTSITTQATLKRAKQLLSVGNERTIRFLSVEPQWESITLRDLLPRLSWVIQGGESGMGATPFAIEWADQLREECLAAGVPYFLKQLGGHVTENGTRLTFRNWEAGDWSEWPRRLALRQLPRQSFTTEAAS
jgi:protein gp37